MPFNTITFVIFFVVVLALHNLPLSWRARKWNLLVASYLFYAAWNPVFVVLIWISTAIDWNASRMMARAKGRSRKRLLLLVSLLVNLGLLGFFKYGGFALDNLVELLGFLGVQARFARPDIVLPVGISFYTFQTMSYVIDVYRGKMKPWGSFLDYALYVTFFPQLVAGPIVRSNDFLPQCIEPKRAGPSQLGLGATMILIGLFHKVVLADYMLAPAVDSVFAAPGKAGAFYAWLGAAGFSGQIFFDFAGYSLCAIGAAMCLGFSIPDNFNSPYAAAGFRDFWRRWHISLSTWLRDYLYISLGGNRKGVTRTYVNLALTMLLGGLWHGAAWGFVAWGALHALYLVIERVATRYLGEARVFKTWPGRAFLVLLTYALVCVAWVFFRASDFGGAFDLIAAMFTGGGGELILNGREVASVVAAIGFMLVSHWLFKDATLERMVARTPWPLRAMVLAGMLLAVVMLIKQGDNRAFIYFQF